MSDFLSSYVWSAIRESLYGRKQHATGIQTQQPVHWDVNASKEGAKMECFGKGGGMTGG